jgi:hypothetical protein
MFAPRYLKNNGEPALRLRRLLDGHLVHEALVQLFFLQTARAQQILADFVRDVYWPKYGAGSNAVTKADAESFIQRALDEGQETNSAPSFQKFSILKDRANSLDEHLID